MAKTDFGVSRFTLSIRIFSPLSDKYYGDKSIFRSKNYAAERAIEAYPFIREYALDSLKGVFSDKELKYVIENLKLEKNPTFLTSLDSLTALLSRNLRFLHLEEDNLEYKSTISKLSNLNDIQVVVLTEFVTTFINYDKSYKTKNENKSTVKFRDYFKRIL